MTILGAHNHTFIDLLVALRYKPSNTERRFDVETGAFSRLKLIAKTETWSDVGRKCSPQIIVQPNTDLIPVCQRFLSIRIFIEEAAKNRQKHNLQIKSDAPVTKIVQVAFYSLIN
jgi:hypothetical protein